MESLHLPKIFPFHPSKVTPSSQKKQGFPLDQLNVPNAATLIELRKQLRLAKTRDEYLQRSREYHIRWKEFAHYIELRRGLIKVNQLITYCWKPADSLLNEEYQSHVARFESMMTACCYAQHLYMNARRTGDPKLFMEAYHLFEFEVLDNRKAWVTARDTELPFEITYTGCMFYMKLCMYGIQRLAILKECMPAIGGARKELSNLVEENPPIFTWTRDQYDRMIGLALFSIRLLETLTYTLKGFQWNDLGTSYVYASLERNSLEILNHDLTLMLCIAGFCISLKYDKLDFRVHDRYTEYLLDNVIGPYKGAKSPLLKCLFEYIEREKKASDRLKMHRINVPQIASSDRGLFDDPQAYLFTSPDALVTSDIQRDKYYFIENVHLRAYLSEK